MSEGPNAASVAIFDADRLLLVQRNRPPYRGCWTLPGGRLEPGETAEAAAAREIAEELGLTLGRLLPVLRFCPDPVNTFILQVFVTLYVPGTIVPSNEIAGFGWYDLADLATLRTTPSLDAVVASARRALDAC